MTQKYKLDINIYKIDTKYKRATKNVKTIKVN